MNPSWLVITDLDGTLLDHHSYDWQPASTALARLEALGIPLILNSSKTRAELADLRQALGHHHPYIAENGAVVTIPAGYFAEGDAEQTVSMGAEHKILLAVLLEARASGFRFQSFHDMTSAELAELTGLTTHAAALAKQRCATEPLIWQGTDIERADFGRYLRKHGLQLQAGGRFWHVMGQFDKADAVRYLAQRFQNRFGTRCNIIALGDGPNDQAMLRQADIAVVIPGTRSHQIDLTAHSHCIHAKSPGPVGWNQTMHELLDNLKIQANAVKDISAKAPTKP